MIFNRVWAIGSENYIRIYPNPGFGFKWGRKTRVAISIYRGIEVFKKDPKYIWLLKSRRLNYCLKGKK